MILFIVLVIVGGVLGAVEGSVITGAMVGFLAAWVSQLSGTVSSLRKELQQALESGQLGQASAESQTVTRTTSDAHSLQQTDWLAEEVSIQPASAKSTVNPNITEITPPTQNPTPSSIRDDAWAQEAALKSAKKAEAKPSVLSKAFGYAKDWFVGGNPFVRAGIVLLFIGVVFLLRYSLERGLIPVELRLAGAAATALVLLFFGWRLRERAGSYGLILQAGGIGLLYLTVFGAFSLYHVIPSIVAFGLLVVIVVAGVLLAVLQNSLPLAMFATAGGFLAPILTSSGSNNYIGLFSFYALLNIGILVIAWFKSWRVLNLLGFVFTFVIASVWGNSSYQPEFFVSTEPFLILFFLLYVAIAVLFAIRTPVNFKDKVDSTLVFGVPVIGFGMQVALVKDFEYGIAISALVMGFFYLLLSAGLWKRYGKPQKLLAETFLSLGVIFATLSVPFAVDGALTSATWAIEGVGILWVSIRQQQWVRRAFAIFLHFAALAALGYQAAFNLFNSVDATAFANGDFVALLLITVSMLICSRLLSNDFEGRKAYEKGFSVAMFFIAIGLQWLAFEWEIVRFGLLDSVIELHLIYAVILTALLSLSARFKAWDLLAYLFPVSLFLMAVSLLKLMESGVSLTMGNGIWLWPLALVGMYIALYLHGKKERFTKLLAGMHAAMLWLVALLLTSEVVYQMGMHTKTMNAWYIASLPLVALAIIWLVLLVKRWPIAQYRDTLISAVAMPFAGLTGLWVLLSLTSSGSAEPLPWLPVLNPLDVVVAFVGLILFKLYQQLSPTVLKGRAEMMRYAAIFIAFVFINVTVLRVLHHWYGYAWQFPDLLQQPVTQTSLAIVWTLFGMTLAWRGNRTLSRNLWFAGAGLLGLVVLKLFIVDFASSGTLERVISFISVGGLLLFIGYLAPMPTIANKDNDDTSNEKTEENENV